MTQVLLVIHLLVTVVMIGLILLQRSEGGGLGVGGGSGGLGSFAGPRATASALTRATMICFILFVSLSLVLAIMAGGSRMTSVLDQLDKTSAPVSVPVDGGDQGAVTPIEPLQNKESPSVPVSE